MSTQYNIIFSRALQVFFIFLHYFYLFLYTAPKKKKNTSQIFIDFAHKFLPATRTKFDTSTTNEAQGTLRCDDIHTEVRWYTRRCLDDIPPMADTAHRAGRGGACSSRCNVHNHLYNDPRCTLRCDDMYTNALAVPTNIIRSSIMLHQTNCV